MASQPMFLSTVTSISVHCTIPNSLLIILDDVLLSTGTVTRIKDILKASLLVAHLPFSMSVHFPFHDLLSYGHDRAYPCRCALTLHVKHVAAPHCFLLGFLQPIIVLLCNDLLQSISSPRGQFVITLNLYYNPPHPCFR